MNLVKFVCSHFLFCLLARAIGDYFLVLLFSVAEIPTIMVEDEFLMCLVFSKSGQAMVIRLNEDQSLGSLKNEVCTSLELLFST